MTAVCGFIVFDSSSVIKAAQHIEKKNSSKLLSFEFSMKFILL